MEEIEKKLPMPGVMNTADLPADHPLQTINGKPVFAIWTAMILGIVLLIAGWWFHGAIVLGILLCALALFVQIKGKSYTQFAFYPDYFVVFNQEDPDHCQKIAWQDVQEWTIDTNHGTTQTLKVKVSAYNQPLLVPLLSSHRVYRIFHKRFPDLETAEIRRQEFRQQVGKSALFHHRRK